MPRGISGSGTEAGGGACSASPARAAAGLRTQDVRWFVGRFVVLRLHGGFFFAQRAVEGRLRRPACGRANPNAGKKAAANMTFRGGDTVDHKTFGRGKVIKVDGDLLHVKFAKNGVTKKLLKDYAPIVRIDS